CPSYWARPALEKSRKNRGTKKRRFINCPDPRPPGLGQEVFEQPAEESVEFLERVIPGHVHALRPEYRDRFRPARTCKAPQIDVCWKTRFGSEALKAWGPGAVLHGVHPCFLNLPDGAPEIVLTAPLGIAQYFIGPLDGVEFFSRGPFARVGMELFRQVSIRGPNLLLIRGRWNAQRRI